MADALHRFLQFVGRRGYGGYVPAAEGGAHRRDFAFHFGFELGGDLVGVVLQHLFGTVRHILGVVARLRLFAAAAVFVGVHFGVAHHLLDFALRYAAARGDGDALLFAGALVHRGYIQDAVGVYVEGNLDLRHTAGRGQNAVQHEAADALVLRRHAALALHHMDLYAGLIIGGGGEGFALGGGNGVVARYERGSHAAERLNAKAERRYIQQQYVLHFALQHARLDGGADGYHFVGVDALMRLFAEQILDDVLHGGHARHAAYQDDFVYIANADAGVSNRLPAGLDRLPHKVIH